MEMAIFIIFIFSFAFAPFNAIKHDLNIKNGINTEIDKKLDEIMKYYKNLLHNKTADNKIIDLFDNEARYLLSNNKTSKNIFNKNPNEIHSSQISFIQNTMNEKDLFETKITFAYQPFVWTEYSTNKRAPTPRRGHSSVIADTYMIIFGGCYMESKCYNDVHFLDFRSKSWTKVNTTGEIPSSRQSHSAVLHGSTMWVFGGSSNDGYLNDLYSLNLETVIKNILINFRENGKNIIFLDKIYLEDQAMEL